MFKYFVLLNKHKCLYLKRKSNFKINLIMIFFSILLSVIIVCFFLCEVMDKDIEWLIVFPILLTFDFSLRFFLKKDPSVEVFPYLCLPIKRKFIYIYILLVDLLSFWIWGGLLVGVAFLYRSGNLTLFNCIIYFILLLLNNYFSILVKIVCEDFKIFFYPVALAFIFFISLIINFIYPILALVSLSCVTSLIIIFFYFELKRKLYKELNNLSI